MQLVGILGLTHNIYRTLGWAFRLKFGKIERLTEPPSSRIPMRSIESGRASHELSVISVTIERSSPTGQAGESGSDRTAKRGSDTAVM